VTFVATVNTEGGGVGRGEKGIRVRFEIWHIAREHWERISMFFCFVLRLNYWVILKIPVPMIQAAYCHMTCVCQGVPDLFCTV